MQRASAATSTSASSSAQSPTTGSSSSPPKTPTSVSDVHSRYHTQTSSHSSKRTKLSSSGTYSPSSGLNADSTPSKIEPGHVDRELGGSGETKWEFAFRVESGMNGETEKDSEGGAGGFKVDSFIGRVEDLDEEDSEGLSLGGAEVGRKRFGAWKGRKVSSVSKFLFFKIVNIPLQAQFLMHIKKKIFKFCGIVSYLIC
jgi:hypothetical protein